jgi:hypothetical protein
MASSQPKESSLGGEIAAGLMGAGIALGCALPPVVHLVTGPLGPFIGGLVAGNRVAPAVRGRIVIGASIGLGLALVIGTVLTVFVSLATASELPTWFPTSAGARVAIVGIVWTYGTLLGTVGATVSGSLSRAKESKDGETDVPGNPDQA